MNKLLCILLIILLLIILYQFNLKIKSLKIKSHVPEQLFYTNKMNIEHFQSNSLEDSDDSINTWFKDEDQIKLDEMPLNKIQKNEVKNEIKNFSNVELPNFIRTQSSLLTGPEGPVGPSGPSGGNYIARGRLVNKKGSHSSKNTNLIPNYVVSRTEGTNKASSLSFMDNFKFYSSFQDWFLGSDNKLKSRYDNNCLTYDDKSDNVYISECTDNPNQNWEWDNVSNRLISTNQNNQDLKCIGLSKPKINALTANVPGCKDDACSNNVERQFLIVKNCDPNNVKEDEVWDFF